MPEIRVTYRRTWQVRQYESEEITMGLTEMVHMDKESPMASAATAQARAQMLSEIEATYYKTLATMGDAIIAERMRRPAATPTSPARPASAPVPGRRTTAAPPDRDDL